MDDTKLKEFEDALFTRFDLEKLGQAHWYLSTCIIQHSSIVIMDQSCYCLWRIFGFCRLQKCILVPCYSSPNWFLFLHMTTPNRKKKYWSYRQNSSWILPLVLALWSILYVVHKLAKYTRLPEENLFHALLYVRRYLLYHSYLGITFFSQMPKTTKHWSSSIWSQTNSNNVELVMEWWCGHWQDHGCVSELL